jgi:hypothetical protein
MYEDPAVRDCWVSEGMREWHKERKIVGRRTTDTDRAHSAVHL